MSSEDDDEENKEGCEFRVRRSSHSAIEIMDLRLEEEQRLHTSP
jgi:hypothetical protein